MNKFQEGQQVFYTPRDSNKKLEYKFRIIDILPQENGVFEDKENKENYWIQSGEEKYLVFPSELSID